MSDKSILDFFNGIDLNIIDDQMQRISDSIVKVDDFDVEDSFYGRALKSNEENQKIIIELLTSIKADTKNLSNIVELIHQSNENQEELIEIAREILSISAATDRADADNRLKKIIGKINDVVTNGEKVIKLIGFATTIYNLVVGLLK